MKEEIEAKFLDIDHREFRQKLESVGANLKEPLRTMRRIIYYLPSQLDIASKRGLTFEYARLRDEGNKITLTYKLVGKINTIDSVKEIETEVGDFDETNKLLIKFKFNSKKVTR